MNTSTRETVPARRLLAVGAVAVMGAALVNAVIYGVGRGAGLDFVAKNTGQGPEHIQLVHVVSLSLFTLAFGLLVTLGAKHFRHGVRTMQIVGAAIALVSITMDFSIDSTVAAKLTLAAMHIVVGIAFVAALDVAHSPRRAAVLQTEEETRSRVTRAHAA